jgi:hypothetical protein
MTALEFHPLSDLFPLMKGAEFDALVADIRANRLRDKIVLYEGTILDGRNRYRALRTLGVHPGEIRDLFCVTRDCIDEHHGGPAAYVISANIHRRHLTAEQKRDLIARLIKAQPEKSNRQIAATAKASHHTVEAVRTKMEGRGQIAHVSERTDTRGRKQPAKKSPKGADRKQSAPKPVKHDARIISPELGERVGRLAYRLIRLDRELARELADLILQRGVAERLWADLDTGIDLEERAS